MTPEAPPQPKAALPQTYLLVSIVGIALLHLMLPGARWLELPWSLIGLVPLAGGAALILLADRAVTRAGTTVEPFEEPSALITNGVFAWSRNPMYVGMVLILFGIAVLVGSLTPFLVPAGFAVLMDRRFIRPEERMLATKFGAQWDAYRARVRRWL
jgi:protein-S-isoprenylcysteine O-methyltransferase Ste14